MKKRQPNHQPKRQSTILICINPTKYQDFDVIAFGDVTLLKQLAQKNKHFHLIKNSQYGDISILVMDTSDTLRGALSCVKAYRELYKMYTKV